MGMGKGRRRIIDSILKLESQDMDGWIMERKARTGKSYYAWEKDRDPYDKPRHLFWKNKSLAKYYLLNSKSRVSVDNLRYWTVEHLNGYIEFLNERAHARRGITLGRDLDLF